MLQICITRALLFSLAILPLAMQACEDPLTGSEFNQHLDISRTSSEGIAHIKVKAPTSIDNNDLSGIYLISNSKDTANVMAIRLALYENKGYAYANFSMAEDLLTGTNVEAWYPMGGCRMISAQPSI